MAKNNSGKTKTTKKPVDNVFKIQTTASVGVVVIALLCFAFLALLEQPQNNSQRLLYVSEGLAKSQAVVINRAIDQLRKRLEAYSLAPDLIAALDDKDPVRIELFRQQLKHSFPEALSVQLVEMGPLGIASLNKSTLSLRNNIELDLLRRASNDEYVVPEAYKYENKWLLTMAEGVNSERSKYITAALMVTFDNIYLSQLLSGISAEQGETRLVQHLAKTDSVIAQHGQAGSGESFTVETDVAHWRIVFSPSTLLSEQTVLSVAVLWTICAVLVLVALAGAVYAALAVQKHVRSNLARLQAREKDGYSLPGFAELAAQLADLGKRAEPSVKLEPQNAESELKPIPVAEPEPKPEPVAASVLDSLPSDLPANIFRAYDIRGIADSELTDQAVHAIAMAIGSEALDQGQQKVIVAMDGRESSPRIKDALVKGLQDSGRDVIDIGMVPTPLMYFATHQLGAQSGVMVTGSHNPAKYNGLKVVVAGRALSGPAIEALRERVLSKQISEGSGAYQAADVVEAYVDYLVNDIAIAQPLKVVLDAGNGVAGVLAPRLFEELGCEVVPLYCDVDGSFPNHHPDPTVESNLADLKAAVAEHNADLGIAFDGDGDRLGVVTGSGVSVPADRLLMLLAQDVVSRNPGADVLFDVKCTRNLNALISNYGGRPIMWKTGHSFMKDKMAETGALLGGEFSGHIFFKERWFGFDDGLYSGARLIEILSTTDPDLDAQLSVFPESFGSPELKVASDDEEKFEIIEKLASMGQFGDGKISTLDGVRVDFSDGWGLVRASNTTPMLILRFEADTEDAMSRIKALFKEQLLTVDNKLQISF
jgi:phosphomannomutase/phosphoglucomutase